jgi:riboflavin-specific deaminase-like protein
VNYQAEQQIRDTGHPPNSAPMHRRAEQWAWALAHAAAQAIGTFELGRPGRFHLEATGHLCHVGPDSKADLLWSPQRGWRAARTLGAAAHAMLDLYLPISSGTVEHPITVAHLGQSLDGFIATASGDSFFVTGPENILHLHRLRALCDAVVVGAGTVSADNPRLTTRLVAGSNPVRVILDPACRLPLDLCVFSDRQAETLRVCAAGNASAHRILAPRECLIELAVDQSGFDLTELLRQLRARGYHRVLIEGGGVTVSSFLRADLLDRLHIAVAPVLIGDGRPAVRLPPRLRLQDCLRLQHRVYRSGDDILFDCDLRSAAAVAGSGISSRAQGSLQRIL